MSVCSHGHLRRQCEACELREENARLERERDEARGCPHGDHCACAIGSRHSWLEAMSKEREKREQAEADRDRLRLAIALEGEDADFYFLRDDECRLFVNLNDTFGYEVADAEPIPWDEFDAVIAAWRKDPTSLVRWAAKKRGLDIEALKYDPRVPPFTRAALAEGVSITNGHAGQADKAEGGGQ